MRKATFVLALLLTSTATASTVCERWAGRGKATHPNTLTVVKGAALRLVFDLKALPKGAEVRHASLYCFVHRGLQPREPAQIGAVGPKDRLPEFLKLEAPWYRSFDATRAVQTWANDPASNQGFGVWRFDGLQAERSYLDITYEGEPKNVPQQVERLRVVHRDGQTFLWWKEIPPYVPPKDSVVWISKFAERDTETAKGPGTGWGGCPNVPAVRVKVIRDMQGVVVKGTRLRRVRPVPQVFYRIYRHTAKITAANIHAAERLAEVPALNAYDLNMKIISYRGEYHDAKEVGASLIPTLPVADGRSVLPGEAIYVHTPKKPGKTCYAVTAVMNGTENLAHLSDGNRLADPIDETPGTIKPVFRFLLKDRYKRTPERWHILYGAPPLSHLPYREFRVLVSVPEKMKKPYPLSISGYTSGYVSMFEWRPSDSIMNLRVEYHTPWGEDGGLCYNEGIRTLRSYSQSKVDYFSARYLRHLIDWAKATWPVDPGRVTGGPLHFAIRHPESTGYTFVGNYTYDYDFKWGGMGGALPRYAGPQDLARTTDGHKAWDVLGIDWYLKNNVGKDIPFVHCVSGTGKDSGHTSEYGWQDDPRGWAALRDARQPFCAFWSTRTNGELRKLLGAMRWDKSIPAFSHCSLDNVPGCGDETHGDYYGQINGYIFWQYHDVLDTKHTWAMTVFLVNTAPDPTCTVDITPRHRKHFKPRPGETFKWTNTSVKEDKAVQSGTVTADQWGLVTLKKVLVTKGRNRITIAR